MLRILLKERVPSGTRTQEIAGDKPEEDEDDVKSSCPLCLGETCAIMDGTKGCNPARVSSGSATITKSSALPLYLSMGWPLVSPPVKNWGLIITSQYAFPFHLSSFMVLYSGFLDVEEQHQSILNLVVKLYCGDNTVGEVMRRNSSKSG
ncbi:hypothetical protein F3Y22_tig00110610pilonHSYRG00526 [Hibiscus syriacus]|uniref:Uncharacterized protein n=1 Tax=Hibiscus syriacus TaxID=106335 RepID=A0A6A3A3K7_HIBSY|nr:hypothetical protein F3Y22_tig00110610pilonHSYRG00526 [Hibiscus syriacus]